jgi:hypothetical protein
MAKKTYLSGREIVLLVMQKWTGTSVADTARCFGGSGASLI